MIGPDVKLVQSMLFIKSLGKPGQAWHQDESHIPTRDRSLTALWIALDDAVVRNGCLWALPGSHRAGVLHPVRPQRDPNFDPTPEAHGFDDWEAEPVEVPAGSAVLFNGYLLHRSLPNRSTTMRRTLVFHYMSANSLLPWSPPAEGETMATPISVTSSSWPATIPMPSRARWTTTVPTSGRRSRPRSGEPWGSGQCLEPELGT